MLHLLKLPEAIAALVEVVAAAIVQQEAAIAVKQISEERKDK